MRSIFLSITSTFAAFSFAQVSQLPQNRSLLLEEFTAINCGNCPAGHVVANAILSAHPDDAVLVNMHAGPLAVPSGAQADFRNTFSTQLHTSYGINFTPQGLVGRRPYNGATALTSGFWVNASNALLALPSPVNIAATTQFDGVTRLLTVQVEYYYTGDGAGSEDRIMVLLTEDHLNGYQQNYGAGGAYASYDHRHVMRAYITPLAGDPVATTAMGSTEVRTYIYTVPESFNIANCRVVAFVAEGAATGYGEVDQVTTAPAASTTNGVGQLERAASFRVFPSPADDVANVSLSASIATRTLTIMDARGRAVMSQTIGSGVALSTLAVGDLPSGLYLVRIPGEMPQRLVITH